MLFTFNEGLAKTAAMRTIVMIMGNGERVGLRSGHQTPDSLRGAHTTPVCISCYPIIVVNENVPSGTESETETLITIRDVAPFGNGWLVSVAVLL